MSNKIKIGRFYESFGGQKVFFCRGYEDKKPLFSVGKYSEDGDLLEIDFNIGSMPLANVKDQLPLFYDCKLIPKKFTWMAKKANSIPIPIYIFQKTETKSNFLHTSHLQSLLEEEIIGPKNGPDFTEEEREI